MARNDSVGLVHVTTVPESLMFLHGQIGYMRERGLRVAVVSSPGERLETFAAGEGIACQGIGMSRRITPFRDLVALARLWWTLRTLRPEIVHAHTPKGGLIGMLAAWLAGTPVRVYHVRGLPLVTARGARRRFLGFAERLSCALAHRVLCVSHSLRTVVLEEGLCPPGKIAVLLGGSGNGVDAVGRFSPESLDEGAAERAREALGIPAAAPVAGFVGRIVRDKGIVELAEAWRAVREAFPEAHLVLVGPLGDEGAIPEEVHAALRSDPRVHLLGARRDTPALYAAMDVLVLPSYREGFPNVPLEAASMRRPVIATRISGCIDAVEDGATGTLVPVRDARSLATAIARYFADPELARRHGEAGRERVLREFRQEPIWEGIYRTYLHLLRARNRALPEPEAREFAV